MKNCVNWLFGRGASVASGLNWTVPKEWERYDREILISKIREILPIEMQKASTAVYKKFLSLLSRKTRSGLKHRLITTNWDFLLQKAIDEQGFKQLPVWLDDSWVFHFNGTVENLPDNSHRSPFLLESDPASQRVASVEANEAYNRLIWDFRFVVVGMSFECQIDKGLLAALNKVEDDLPIGFSEWIFVNSNQNALKQVEQNIKIALPKCKTVKVQAYFEEWVMAEMPVLKEIGVLNT